MTYEPLRNHFPRSSPGAANLNRAPRVALRLVQKTPVPIGYEPPLPSQALAPVELRVQRALEVARIFNIGYAIGVVADAFTVVPFPPVQAVPGGRTIPGWELYVPNYNAVFVGTPTATYTPGQSYGGHVIEEINGVWNYAGDSGYPATHSSMNGFTYVPSFWKGDLPNGFWDNPVGSSTKLLWRKVIRRLNAGVFYDRWDSQNDLWRKVDPGANNPQIVDLPDTWEIVPPLSPTLPLPLAQPGYPLTFPGGRRRRLVWKRLRKVQVEKMSGVQLDFTIKDGVKVRPIFDGEHKPPKGVREGKMASKSNAFATVIFRTWEAAQDWTDWLNIVTRHSAAPIPIKMGSPVAQLAWWRANAMQGLGTVNWAGVAVDLLQWRIDESVGALQGKIASGTRRRTGRVDQLAYSPNASLQGTGGGQSIGTALTQPFRDGVSFALKL